MKKLFLTLIVALGFCGSITAQSYESHWPDFYGPAYMFQGACVAAIELDGTILTADYVGWNAFEVAFFVGDECRGAGSTFPLADPSQYYLYNGYVEEWGDPFPIINGAAVYYNDVTGEEVTVKIYDHLNEVEYVATVTYLGEPFTILTGADNMQGWDDPENPLIFSIVSETPEPEPTTLNGGYWDVTSTWENGEVPVNVDVIINGPVIIPAGYPAHAGNITIMEGGSLTIEEGGELYHTGEVNVTLNMTITPNLIKDGDVENANYRLIASPIYQSIVAAETGLTENYDGMDLYSFDQSYPEEEWRNYKVADNNFTDLAIGKGYLYYNSTTVFVTFFGQTVPTNVIYPIDLTYSDDAQIEEWKGLNLVGNPFTCKATPDRDFYVLNDTGDEVELATEEFVAPMKGFFVLAENGEDQCTMTKYVPSGDKSSLNMSVSQGRNIVDMARLRFGADQSLLKIQLNPNHTKIYMPVEGKNYAVASAPEMGEMPVSFKAESNGTYSLSFANENVTFSYLHLIDNLTGIETDLLATPSYTFDAKTTDYASRFRLVFVTGSNNEEDFAFFSNGNFVINNDGNATLQVIDINGRVIKSESINGCANVNVNAASGVYMLRLINGENVKVQKVVVK